MSESSSRKICAASRALRLPRRSSGCRCRPRLTAASRSRRVSLGLKFRPVSSAVRCWNQARTLAEDMDGGWATERYLASDDLDLPVALVFAELAGQSLQGPLAQPQLDRTRETESVGSVRTCT